MAISLASRQDVEEALLRPLSPTEETYVEGLIAKASELLRLRVQDLDARLALPEGEPGHLSLVIVATVVAGIVARALRNPGGASSVSETAGPFSTVRAFKTSDGGIAAGLFVGADDLALLPAWPVGSRRRVKTVRVPLGQFDTSYRGWR